MIKYVKIVGAPGSGKTRALGLLAKGLNQPVLCASDLERLCRSRLRIPEVLLVDEPLLLTEMQRHLERRHYTGTVYYAATGPA